MTKTRKGWLAVARDAESDMTEEAIAAADTVLRLGSNVVCQWRDDGELVIHGPAVVKKIEFLSSVTGVLLAHAVGYDVDLLVGETLTVRDLDPVFHGALVRVT